MNRCPRQTQVCNLRNSRSGCVICKAVLYVSAYPLVALDKASKVRARGVDRRCAFDCAHLVVSKPRKGMLFVSAYRLLALDMWSTWVWTVVQIS